MPRLPFPLVDLLIGTPSTGATPGVPALLTHGTTLDLYADQAATVPLDATLDEAGTVPVASVTVEGVTIPRFYADAPAAWAKDATTGAVVELRPISGAALMAAIDADAASAFRGQQDARLAVRAPVPASPLVDVTSTPRAGYIVPTEVFDGYLWGFKGGTREIHQSTDGNTWTLVATAPVATVGSVVPEALLKCADGEVLVGYRKQVWRSAGWSTPGAPTWTKVLDINGGPLSYLLRWGIDGDGTRFIVTEYGTPAPDGWTDSRYVWLSDDGGLTWTVVYNSPVAHPGEEVNSHQHGACVDPWAGGRLWYVQGHGASAGVYWSDDDGATWTSVPPPATHITGATIDWPPTTVTATPNGIVCGSDSDAHGIYVIERTTDPADMRMKWIFGLDRQNGGINWFADRGWYDAETGLTWVGFSSRTAGVAPLAIATDGIAAQIVYTGTTTDLTDRVRSIVAYKGKAYMDLELVSGSRVAKGVVRRGVQPPPLDIGRTRGGVQTHDNRSGVAVGPGSKAGYRATAVGDGSEATAATQSVAVGWNSRATGDNSTAAGVTANASAPASTALGQASTASGTNSTTVGKTSTASGSTSTALGTSAQATNTSATALGQASTASGSRSTAAGRSSQATATDSVALGDSAVAGHSTSVALGAATATTGAAQVQVGARHVEVSELGSAPAAPAADRARWFMQDNGAGKSQLCVRFATGAVQILATEP